MTGSAAPTTPAGLAVQRIASLAGMPLPAAAMTYATSGVAVFPCHPGQKRPLTHHGLHDASVDLDRIRSWWLQWPSANIGLPTGQASGLDVLDVDVRAAGSGYDAFNRVRGLGLADKWAMLVRTPSGGLHAYYPAAPGRPQRCWQAADAHLDFRGDGGYIIAPPSVIQRPDGSIGRYVVSVLAPQPPGALDAEAIRDLLIPRPLPAPENGPRVRATAADADRLAAWVAARGEGERNRGLFWAACRLAEHGTTPAEIEASLGPAAGRAGLPAAEIAATIRSATRTATQSPSAAERQDASTPSRPLAIPSVGTPVPQHRRDAPVITR